MNDIRFCDSRVNFIIQDTDRILELTKSSVILREFDQSIALLMSYLGEMATLDREMKKIIDARRLRRQITQQEEVANMDFEKKRTEVVTKLNNDLDMVQKRRKVIVKIAEGISKRSNSKTEKKLAKVSPAKNSSKSNTKKVVTTTSSDKTEKDIATERIELQKAHLKMEKEREKQEKQLAKEREKHAKQLAKEREKQEKSLIKKGKV